MECLKILFIRHANTDYSDKGDRDNCDGNLTALGEKQCALLGERLKDTKIDGYISSTLLRAFKTAVGVCEKKREKPLINICAELIECGCTKGYYGCTKEYLDKYYDNTAEINLFDVPKSFGVESEDDNTLRAEKTIDYIKNTYGFGKTVAVFSHHGMLEYLIPVSLGIKPHSFSFGLENISVTEVEIYEDNSKRLSYSNKI